MNDNQDTVSPRLHIGGQWRDGATSWALRNPADTRQIVTQVPEATTQDVEEAVASAVRGAKIWRETPAFERGQVLAKAAAIIDRRRVEFARAVTIEMGKPIVESRVEVGRAVEQTQYFATTARHPEGYTAQLATNSEMGYTFRAPIGVVGLICPWNFPAMITNWKLAPALAFGNAVVFKPAEIAPLSATLLVEAYLEAGVPADALNLILGRGSVVGPALISHRDVAGISFTGSTPVGTRIAADAARHGKRAQCEMGGKNAIVVMPDANLDDAIAAIMVGGFGTSGQRCTSSSRVLAHREIVDELQRRMEEGVDRLVVGPGLDERTTVGPMASQQQLTDTLAGLERAVVEGAKVLRGGARLVDGEYAHGWFLEPTLLRASTAGAAFHEELFGPIVSIHEFDTLDEAIELNNAVEYGLSAAIYTRDLVAAHRFIRETDTGMVHVNRPTVGAEPHLPFGGAKASALGTSELGAAGDFYTKTRSAHLRWEV
ncbi:aldehyde dehydrogenase family protein [Rhodococcus koreensis]